MKNLYRNSYGPFHRPPTSLFKVKLDNIIIVPASMLPFKDTWQRFANTLPQGSVLICHSSTNNTQIKLLEKVENLFRQKGLAVKRITVEQAA